LASSSSAGLEPGAWIVIANIKGPQGDIGETGSSGAQGDAGPSGADGIDGQDGNRWYSDYGPPSDDMGLVDDYYIDLTNGDIYERIQASSSSSGDNPGAWIVTGNIKGATGAQGVQGPQGEQGPPGEHTVTYIDADDYMETGEIPIDRDQADIFEIELGSEELVIQNPTGSLIDGMVLLFRVSRPGGASSSSSSAGSTPGLTFDDKYIGSTTRELPTNVLPTYGTADELLFCYHADTETWRFIGLIEGFSLT